MAGARFTGKVAVVVGGTSGIGLAAARQLVDEGARVVVAGRSVDRGDEALAQLDSSMVRFVSTNVIQRQQVDALMASVTDVEGRLDVLVNSAGQVVVSPFATIKPEHWRRTIEINLTSVFDVCQAALGLLRQSAVTATTGWTSIVNVASINGVGGDRGMSGYSAAKAGVVNLSRSLALELAPAHVRVNCVSPGAVATPMSQVVSEAPELAARYQQAIPIGRLGRPEEIAAGIAFAASDEASFLIGSNIVIDGGVTSATGHPDLLSHLWSQ